MSICWQKTGFPWFQSHFAELCPLSFWQFTAYPTSHVSPLTWIMFPPVSKDSTYRFSLKFHCPADNFPRHSWTYARTWRIYGGVLAGHDYYTPGNSGCYIPGTAAWHNGPAGPPIPGASFPDAGQAYSNQANHPENLLTYFTSTYYFLP